MIQRLVLAIIAAGALLAAAVSAVVAATYAVFSLLKPELGSAGASGAVAGGLALLMLIGALAAWMKARPHTARRAKGGDPMAGLVQMARDRPIIAAGALVAASVIAFRNPAITALVVKSFFDSRKPPKR